MKKILLLVVGLVLALVIAGCSDDGDNSENGGDNNDPVVYTAPSDIIERVEAGETFAFVIGDETCSACNHYLDTTLTEVKEDHDVVLPFIELHGIEQREEDRVNVVDLIDNHLEGQFGATPTTYYIIDGVLADVTVGAITYDEFVDLYETHIGPIDGSEEEITEGETEEEANVEEVENEEDPNETPDVEEEETEEE